MEEECWQPEEQREERDYQLRPQICGLLFSLPKKDFLIKENLKKEKEMSQFYSLKKSRDFHSVYRTGKSLANRYLVVYVKKRDDDGENRVGISVSKKVGNSVVRHRLKRLIREGYRLNCGQATGGHDVVVIAREKSNGRTYREIERALLSLLKSHRLI